MDRKEAVEYIKRHMGAHRIGKYPHIKLGEALSLAIEALQEKEQIIKQLEELRDDPIMYCSEDYWEGHYMAAKEAIAIVRGEEESQGIVMNLKHNQTLKKVVATNAR